MVPDAPLAAAVDAFLRDPGTTFTVPGHKRAPGIVDGLLMQDLPLVSGADDSRLGADVGQVVQFLEMHGYRVNRDGTPLGPRDISSSDEPFELQAVHGTSGMS